MTFLYCGRFLPEHNIKIPIATRVIKIHVRMSSCMHDVTYGYGAE